MLLLAFLVLFTLTLVRGLDVEGAISAHAFLPSPALLPPSTQLFLSAPGTLYHTHPAPNGAFIFRNVTAGPSYLFKIESITHSFPSLRIDTAGNSIEVYQTFKGNDWSHKGAQLEYPLHISPLAKADYYVVSLFPLRLT
jgi:hypothetical protein